MVLACEEGEAKEEKKSKGRKRKKEKKVKEGNKRSVNYKMLLTTPSSLKSCWCPISPHITRFTTVTKMHVIQYIHTSCAAHANGEINLITNTHRWCETVVNAFAVPT